MVRTLDAYRKLKVPELKDLLRESSLALTGKKDDLIARLMAFDAAEAAEPVPQDEPEMEVDSAEPLPEPTPDVTAAAEILLEPVPVLAAVPAPETTVHAREEDVSVPLEDARPAKRVRVDEPVEQEAETAVNEPDAEEAVLEVVEAVEKPVVEEEEPPEYNFEPEVIDLSASDMYLDTINRSALDFDFERLCSVTLSQNNIYACLVDGKYFQGRGRKSPAYAHSIAEDKHVYINMTTLKVYILPDGYEVTDPSLDDIKYLLYPTFTPALLKRIDASITPVFDLAQTPYYPGFVGLNNIKSNSYMNAILHALLHVIPLRDYFILSPLANAPEATELVKRFSMLCRKVWNPRAFKGQVSPHEFLQECSNASGKRFRITEPGDPLEFLGWLLNQLHTDLGGSRKSGSSIIHSAFQGEIRIDDQQVLTTGEYGGKPRFDLDREVKSARSPFLFLAIDLPPPPLFQDVIEKNIIPQVPLAAVLAKYDGLTTQEAKGALRRFKITKLPPFLILHIRRFTKNNFVEEKNPTIVNFPLRGIDMREYVDPTPDLATYYDLVSNITHSSAAGTAREETTWKAQVHLRPPRGLDGQLRDDLTEDDERWFQIQDLIVEEINREMISLGESYIQIWERRTPTGEHDLVVLPPKVKKSAVKPSVPAN